MGRTTAVLVIIAILFSGSFVNVWGQSEAEKVINLESIQKLMTELFEFFNGGSIDGLINLIKDLIKDGNLSDQLPQIINFIQGFAEQNPELYNMLVEKLKEQGINIKSNTNAKDTQMLIDLTELCNYYSDSEDEGEKAMLLFKIRALCKKVIALDNIVLTGDMKSILAGHGLAFLIQELENSRDIISTLENACEVWYEAPQGYFKQIALNKVMQVYEAGLNHGQDVKNRMDDVLSDWGLGHLIQ